MSAQRPTLVYTMVAATMLACAVFGALRFVALDADFPGGITTSGDLYTDEGWYTSAALSAALDKRWYTPGDFNPAINMPVFPVLQNVAFTLAGPSLAAARSVVALSFVLLAVLASRLVWREGGIGIALLALLVFATNFTLFAYSRFAIVEIPMLTLTLASVVLLADATPSLWKVVAAAVCLVLALLTKTTAIFIVPTLVYLAWTGVATRRRQYATLGILGVALLLAAVYHLLAYLVFTQDYVYFNQRNIAERVRLHPVNILRNLVSVSEQLRVLDGVVYTTCLLAPLIVVSPLRRSRIVVALIIWVASYLGLLALTGYHPARYMLPFVVPALLLLVVTVGTLWTRYSSVQVRGAIAVMIGAVAVVHAVEVIGYLRAPQYTFLTMARDIERRIAASDQPDGILMGDIANTVSLATGQPSINARWGTQSIAWKLARYAPAFYVTLGEDEEIDAIIPADHDLELLAVYDVFGNYYDGERVYFYAIEPPANDG